MGKKIVIGLLSHMLEDVNLGCVALSISNIKIIEEVLNREKLEARYVLFVNEKMRQPQIDFIHNEYEYRVYSSCKKTLKHPIQWITSNIFNDCDIVFNICAGDGFTSIYGIGRTFSETYMSWLAKMNKCKIVLAPQTIGPFENILSCWIAKRTLKYIDLIFTRDVMSTNCCESMGVKEKTIEVIDVAFALPYQKQIVQKNKIGINVSGLLYRGGYNGNNYFGLSFNYQLYIKKLIKVLLSQGFYMVGNKGETKETMEETLNLALKLDTDTAQFYPLLPFPGTEAYYWAKENGYIKGGYADYVKEDGTINSLLELPEISSEEMVYFCDEARRKYYLRPKYILHRLLMGLKDPEDLKRSLKAFKKIKGYLFKVK